MIKHKFLLYKAILRPVLLYGYPIWGTTSINPLLPSHGGSGLSASFALKPKMADLRRLPSFEGWSDFMKITSKKFFEKLPQIPNVLLQLPPYDPVVPSSRKRPRTMLDYTYETFPTVKRRRDSSTIDANLDP
ncbi:hypothetical protein AVEN_193540-1 [Araneus ventricosus]|uniref:Uncharacterized protein n=1 Tax=Araneus ventricosus TaxID=182803 RepID=A0A4Y2T735_ARAVE|nr:hypothetical protein AVEN_193540-1 [Araneus ventricosus]